MVSRDRLVWVVPEDRGGIRSYADTLWPYVSQAASQNGIEVAGPLYDLFNNPNDIERSIQKLVQIQPTLIHVQHEFGLFGSKAPGFYLFPKWLKQVRASLPHAIIFATAHTVLGTSYSYSLTGRGWQTPFRWFANQFLLPWIRTEWLQGTWGGLDGVFVHSSLQKDSVRQSGCPWVHVVPHFVPKVGGKSDPNGENSIKNNVQTPLGNSEKNSQSSKTESPIPRIIVFGFITPEKGQDLAIQAIARLSGPAKLIIAGGGRRPADRRYVQRCVELIQRYSLSDIVSITGFIEDEDVDRYYREADLVLAPFRETSGSGSIVQALARGAPILASNLPLNREIDEREPGCLAFFKSDDPDDCATKIQQLLDNKVLRASLSAGALRYAKAMSPEVIATEYVRGYERN